MDSSAVEVVASPYAFAKRRADFRDIMLRDGKKIISEDFLSDNPGIKHDIKKYILETIFNAKIIGAELTDADLKPILRQVLHLINCGVARLEALQSVLSRENSAYDNNTLDDDKHRNRDHNGVINNDACCHGKEWSSQPYNNKNYRNSRQDAI